MGGTACAAVSRVAGASVEAAAGGCCAHEALIPVPATRLAHSHIRPTRNENQRLFKKYLQTLDKFMASVYPTAKKWVCFALFRATLTLTISQNGSTLCSIIQSQISQREMTEFLQIGGRSVADRIPSHNSRNPIFSFHTRRQFLRIHSRGHSCHRRQPGPAIPCHCFHR